MPYSYAYARMRSAGRAELPGRGRPTTKARHTINRIDRQAEAVDLILNGQFQRRVDVALLLVAADVDIVWLVRR